MDLSQFTRPLAMAILVVAILSTSVCGQSAAQTSLFFEDTTKSSGLAFIHRDGGGANGYLVSMMGSGLALADFDSDGWVDAYLLNGQELPRGAKYPNALVRNLHGVFADATLESDSAGNRYGLGVSVADYDNDGFPDILLVEFGGVTLLQNQGDGTFLDVSTVTGLAESGITFGAGATFLDIDNDGNLDLFVADYVDFTFPRYREVLPKSYPYPPGPEDFKHLSDKLFKSDGEGGFANVSLASGISDHRRPSMGAISGDFDQDGDSDIFVCCDARPNLLFINDGAGKFSEDAVVNAAAYNSQAVPVGAMGAAAGDYDNDGIEDLFVTSYSGQLPILFQNSGEYGFEDVTLRTRSGASVVPHANWGSSLADFDNDGDRDLLIANGHLMKQIHEVEQMTDFRVANTLMENAANGIFTDVSSTAGPGLELVESSRGLATADLNNDGRVDCVVLNNDGPANVLRNASGSNNSWLEVRLVGTSINRSAVGAKVAIELRGKTQVAYVRSGSGYQSYDCPVLHFGLGQIAVGAAIDRVTINWGGQTTQLENVPANQVLTLVEPQ